MQIIYVWVLSNSFNLFTQFKLSLAFEIKLNYTIQINSFLLLNDIMPNIKPACLVKSLTAID